MQAGSFTVTLNVDTPRSVLETIGNFGHIYTFDAQQIRHGLSDATMISLARWGGPVRIRPTTREVGGANMIVWLSDEDGKGVLLETTLGSGAGQAFAVYVNALIPGRVTAIHIGTLTAVAGTTKTIYPIGMSARAVMDDLCRIFSAEYRVNKDWTIDTAPVGSTAMFVQTPTAAAIRRSSGRDLGITGISVTQLDVSIDAEEYFVRAMVHDGTGAYTSVGTGATYFDGFGNALLMNKLFEQPNLPTAEAAALATTLSTNGAVLRNAVTLTTDEFDIDRDVKVGDWIWVYDEDGAIKDTTNQIRYRGSFIYPMKLRVLGITWPIERGMSVWFRPSKAVVTGADWVDLTNFVEFEPPGASFEVGAPVRALLTKP